ncbi:unnamed protein product [Camellia sinensis]
MTRNTATLRNLIRCNRILSSSVTETLISSPNPTVSYSNSLFSSKKPFFTATTTAAAAKFQLPQHISIHRCLSSPPSGPSNIVVIDSEEKFSSSFRKVQDETLPAIFYFTAVWCGPCRLLSPIIGQLSEKYPHVTIYKIDIDQEELGSKLSELNIHSVPALHFYKDGKKASEVIGADVQRLKDAMENLYK